MLILQELKCQFLNVSAKKLYTELTRTFLNIFSSNFQGEPTSVFYLQLCDQIINLEPQKYVGRKIQKF